MLKAMSDFNNESYARRKNYCIKVATAFEQALSKLLKLDGVQFNVEKEYSTYTCSDDNHVQFLITVTPRHEYGVYTHVDMRFMRAVTFDEQHFKSQSGDIKVDTLPDELSPFDRLDMTLKRTDNDILERIKTALPRLRISIVESSKIEFPVFRINI